MLRGIGVSPGVAWAPALVVRLDFPDVPDRTVAPDEVEGEITAFEPGFETFPDGDGFGVVGDGAEDKGRCGHGGLVRRGAVRRRLCR